MRVALGESLGIAKVHIDLRRGDGPAGARFYNFPAFVTTDQLIEQHPEVAAGAIRAIVNTQRALKADPSLATKVGEALLPVKEASLIATLIERDTPFYAAHVSREAIDGLMKLGLRQKLLSAPVAYDDLVATQFQDLWSVGAA
jgi:ABC-type nitrate/sulfonate/bicarbonate transport system substrate-binding protein